MTDIIRINLDNELDLILAHKRAMKLAELCGLASSSQTRFATAVSEIARCSISSGEKSSLILGINFLAGSKKEINAIIYDAVDLEACHPEAYAYASRLSKSIIKRKAGEFYEIHLSFPIQYSGTITPARISSFADYFKSEAPLSPYDEIRKKNIQLIELSEKLIDSENSYRQLSDALPLIVFSIGNTGNVTVVNKMAAEILGKKFDTFTPTTMSFVFHEQDYIAVSQGWDVARKKGHQYQNQIRLKVKDSFRWHLLLIVPNKDESGYIESWIVSMVDIHAQKLVEETLKDNQELRNIQENLRAMNEELQRKNRELEQFAYVASHDLQEPLRKIRNFISLAERSATAEQKSNFYFDKIGDAAERMSFLVRDILNYSTLAKSSHFEPTDLNNIVQEVLNDLELPFAEKKAAIEVESLPVIDAIPSQMSQLFYNLLSNALKFSNELPRIKVSYSLERAASKIEGLDHGKAYHSISVHDNGIGIEEQYRSKIFSIFQRLHPQSAYRGTGIGLSLCKRIAENHQGAIGVESVPGNGSVFTIYLPK